MEPVISRPLLGPAPRGGDGTGPLAVQLRAVRKRFGHVEAVRGIDLHIRAGEVVAYLGPNGAGKTSTIDMILGLSRPTAGDVSVYGMAPSQAVRRGLVSAVMQSGGLLKDLTVAETVQYTAALFADTRPVGEVLERAGIDEIAGRLVGKCSGGEQQRLRFAMALLPDPELLILDEPTQGMDVEGRRDFWRSIRQDASQGRTIMFATHYLEEADSYADRIVL
ncbi:MAG: ABC transporter ATP-binding protein, partial [Acidimicrobiales bacterium]